MSNERKSEVQSHNAKASASEGRTDILLLPDFKMDVEQDACQKRTKGRCLHSEETKNGSTQEAKKAEEEAMEKEASRQAKDEGERTDT